MGVVVEQDLKHQFTGATNHLESAASEHCNHYLGEVVGVRRQFEQSGKITPPTDPVGASCAEQVVQLGGDDVIELSECLISVNQRVSE